jgi:DNA invertase Pin-like site-specific DNA recombinase
VKKGRVTSIPKVIGYLRVSTGFQDLKNQKLGILKLANEHGWKVDFIEETVSGRVSYKDREIGKVVKELKAGDVLIVSELSRLGRSMLEIMTLLCELAEKNIRVYAIKGNHKVDNSIQSKILTMVLCMASEIEKDLISQRTKEALQRKKQEGVKLGRPKGVPGKSKLDGKEDEIRKLLDKDVGIASLAKIYDCSWPTMKNFINKKVFKNKHK